MHANTSSFMIEIQANNPMVRGLRLIECEMQRHYTSRKVDLLIGLLIKIHLKLIIWTNCNKRRM
jgi:hypothetical protein